MYTYVKSVVKDNRPNSRYREVDLSDATLEYTLSELRDVHHELSHPLLDNNVTVKVDDIVSQLLSLQGSLTTLAWLTINGNNALPTVPGIPVINTGSVVTADAWAANFKVELCDEKGIVTVNTSRLNMVDMILTRPYTDYKKLYESCLVSVNGLLHLTDYNVNNGLYVTDGGISSGLENRNQVSLLSFEKVGKLTNYPITDDMITNVNGRPLRDGVIITIPGCDFSDKSVMLSLGGFLHLGNQDYRVVSENAIRIDWHKLDIPLWYLLARKKVSLTDFMETVDDSIEDELLSIDLHNSDESIRELLKLSQSFVITVDAPHMFVEWVALEPLPFPGRYRCEFKPIEPLRLSNGFMPPYVVKKEAGVYCVIVDDNWEYRYVHDLRGPDQGSWLRAGCISQYPKRLSMGHLLTIGKEVCNVELCGN